jgi:hypothetical protein
MFSKNNTLWLQNVLVVLLISLVFVIPTSAVTYTQQTQSTIDDMTSETVATWPIDRSRTTIGIGEEVVCSIDSSTWTDKDCRNYTEEVSDTIGDRVWACEGNGLITPTGVTSSDSTTLTADKSPGICAVVVNVYDSKTKYSDGYISKPETFTVIAPTYQIYYKDYDDPTWTAWSSGTKYMRTRTVYKPVVQPTSVSFANVDFQENFGDGETDTFPDGSTFFWPFGQYPFDPDQYNQWSDTHYSGGPYSIDRLYTGSEWQDFSPRNSIPLQYKNESATWVTFDTPSGGHDFYYLTGKSRSIPGGVAGGLQGPWQAP